ncbi:MAG: tRNA (N6-threonylcarbamoyladenosine(37)-N6)-methyltransferase TrmO [Clostridiales bacterium]|nr:tRNA (N6-threonylcarbamoyladenosine(37)-N6)-methyltransferase TrmO [Clostridiales bacterium]
MKVIGHIYNGFDELFGIPRQAGIVSNTSEIVFEKEFSDPSFFIGLEEFNYIWLIWEFSENTEKGYHPTVRPPKLGGNIRKGVFASRSPFRPNPIGISSVKLKGIRYENNTAIISVEGADLKNGTPIYDIKPYLPYADIHEDAVNGYADTDITPDYEISINTETNDLPPELLNEIIELAAQNPVPGYKEDTGEYGVSYAGYNIRFVLNGKSIKIVSIEKGSI